MNRASPSTLIWDSLFIHSKIVASIIQRAMLNVLTKKLTKDLHIHVTFSSVSFLWIKLTFSLSKGDLDKIVLIINNMLLKYKMVYSHLYAVFCVTNWSSQQLFRNLVTYIGQGSVRAFSSNVIEFRSSRTLDQTLGLEMRQTHTFVQVNP